MADAALRLDLAYVDALLAGHEPAQLRHGPAALPGLNRIAERHHLTALDRDLLLLASAADLSRTYAAELTRVDGDPRPSVGFALAAFDRSDLSRELLTSRLVAGSPLLVNGLIELRGDGPFAAKRLVVPDVVWQRMLGIAPVPILLSEQSKTLSRTSRYRRA
jgi:hypothetical protein